MKMPPHCPSSVKRENEQFLSSVNASRTKGHPLKGSSQQGKNESRDQVFIVGGI
jgi:hypothetical protein